MQNKETNHNEITENIKRFEMMEKGEKNFFFDVDTIEILFDFYIDKFDLERASKILKIGINQHPESMSLHIKEAYIYMEEEQYDDAINKLESIASIESTNFDIYLNLAFAYSFKEEIHKVRQNLDLAIKYVPSVDDLLDLLYDIAAFFNEQDKHFITIQFTEPFYSFYDKNEDFILELAFAYFESDHTDKAIEVYKKILDNDPFLENIWYNLGSAYLKKNDYQQSLEAFDFALAIDSEHSFSYLGKAEVFELIENYFLALDNLLEYISYSFDYIAYEKAAVYLIRLNRIPEAIRYLEIAVKKSPFYNSIWDKLISLLIENKQYDKALKYSEESLKYHDKYDNIWHLNGIVSHLLGKKLEALYAYKRAFKLSQDNLIYFDKYVRLKLELDSKIKEIDLLKYLEEKYPESAIHYLLVGYYLFKERDLKLAGFHLEMSLYETSALFRDFVDLFPKAIKEIKKSVRLSKILLEFDPNIFQFLNNNKL